MFRTDEESVEIAGCEDLHRPGQNSTNGNFFVMLVHSCFTCIVQCLCPIIDTIVKSADCTILLKKIEIL